MALILKIEVKSKVNKMEEVTDQIDRLNFALQQVMDGIANVTCERPVRMSITSADWMEKDSEDSLSIPDHYEDRIESLIQQLDQVSMLAEDLWSAQFREQRKLTFTKSEIRELITQFHQLQQGKPCTLSIGSETYSVSLDNREFGEGLRDFTVIENSIMDCGHDIARIRREIAMDVERKLQSKRNHFIDEARKGFEIQLEEIEKLKSTYVDKLKDLVIFSNQLEKRGKNIELKELQMQKTLNSGDLPEDLEQKIRVLQSAIDNTDSEDHSKISLQIDQLKNKITNMRVEKVINESKQTTSVLSRLTKAMEKEVSNDEKQRKKLLEKFHQAHNRAPSDLDRPSISSLKKQEENFKLYMEKVRSRIKKKEQELAEKEKLIEEKLSPVTGSKDFLDLMKQSVDKINEMKEENEKEREILEREKLDIVNWNEKIKRVWAGIEGYRKNRGSKELAEIRQQVNDLKFDPGSLGFD